MKPTAKDAPVPPPPKVGDPCPWCGKEYDGGPAIRPYMDIVARENTRHINYDIWLMGHKGSGACLRRQLERAMKARGWEVLPEEKPRDIPGRACLVVCDLLELPGSKVGGDDVTMWAPSWAVRLMASRVLFGPKYREWKRRAAIWRVLAGDHDLQFLVLKAETPEQLAEVVELCRGSKDTSHMKGTFEDTP